MSVGHQEIFERYIVAGAMTRNADALVELFTPDGVVEAPLVPAGRSFPQRLEGRDAIRDGLAAYYDRAGDPEQTVNLAESRYVLHETADPDVFIAEIDTALDGPDGRAMVSLVQIFRLREGKIASLRDYFSPDLTG